MTIIGEEYICKLDGCQKHFIATGNNQRYCCPDHSSLANKRVGRNHPKNLICKVCGEKFKSLSGGRRYCDNCKKGNIFGETICKFCGEILLKKSFNNTVHKKCSIEKNKIDAKKKAKKRYDELHADEIWQCQICKNEYPMVDIRNGRRKYCDGCAAILDSLSLKERNRMKANANIKINKYPKKEKICEMCGKPFTGKWQRKYCKECKKKVEQEKYLRNKIFNVGLIFRRDNHQCFYCGRTSYVDRVKLVCDHVVPAIVGGLSRAYNLVTACKDCNSNKGDTVYSYEQLVKILSEVEKRNIENGLSNLQQVRFTPRVKLEKVTQRYKATFGGMYMPDYFFTVQDDKLYAPEWFAQHGHFLISEGEELPINPIPLDPVFIV